MHARMHAITYPAYLKGARMDGYRLKRMHCDLRMRRIAHVLGPWLELPEDCRRLYALWIF